MRSKNEVEYCIVKFYFGQDVTFNSRVFCSSPHFAFLSFERTKKKSLHGLHFQSKKYLLFEVSC